VTVRDSISSSPTIEASAQDPLDSIGTNTEDTLGRPPANLDVVVRENALHGYHGRLRPARALLALSPDWHGWAPRRLLALGNVWPRSRRLLALVRLALTHAGVLVVMFPHWAPDASGNMLEAIPVGGCDLVAPGAFGA